MFNNLLKGFKVRVLHLEGEDELSKSISEFLSQTMIVDTTETFLQAKAALSSYKYDFLLFDRYINSEDIALELIEFSREENRDAFIIILGSCCTVTDKIECLDFGANECMVKPIHLEELVAKMNALQRQNSLNKIELNGLTCTTHDKRIYFEGQEIVLTQKENELFFYLLMNRHKIVSQEQLIHALYNHPQNVLLNTIHATIKHIRQKIPRDLIRNIKKRGYTINE